MEIKAKVIEVLQRAQTEERAMVEAMTDDERSAKGTLEKWAPKDVVGHILGWKVQLEQKLAAAIAGEIPESHEYWNPVNAMIFEHYRDYSWEDLLAESEQTQGELIARIEALSEEDLIDADRFPWQKGTPLWKSIVSLEYTHAVYHYGSYFRKRGDHQRAVRMLEATVELLSGLDDSPQWRGTVIYNLACFLALGGIKETAIAKLSEALRLNPDLTEWSKEYMDFASIREEPGYKAIFSNGGGAVVTLTSPSKRGVSS